MDSKGAREEEAEEKEVRDYAIMDHVMELSIQGYILLAYASQVSGTDPGQVC